MTDDKAPAMSEQEFRKCPFCGELDFDLRGLKAHLQQDCASFDLVDVSGIFFPFSEQKIVRVPKEPTLAMSAYGFGLLTGRSDLSDPGTGQ